MHRHRTDLVGLLFGPAFAIAGVGFLVHEVDRHDRSIPAWATGLGLMLLGAVALVGTLARGPRHDHVADFDRSTSPRPADMSEPRSRTGRRQKADHVVDRAARRACRWRGPCARRRPSPDPLAPTTSCTGTPTSRRRRTSRPGSRRGRRRARRARGRAARAYMRSACSITFGGRLAPAGHRRRGARRTARAQPATRCRARRDAPRRPRRRRATRRSRNSPSPSGAASPCSSV